MPLRVLVSLVMLFSDKEQSEHMRNLNVLEEDYTCHNPANQSSIITSSSAFDSLSFLSVSAPNDVSAVRLRLPFE